MESDKELMPITLALQWAFGVEYAQLDFEDDVDPDELGYGFGTEYILMKRQRLGGVKIDASPVVHKPHPDAEIISSFVAKIPEEVGGRRQAIVMAIYGRTGLAPDWMRGAKPMCRPAALKHKGKGMAATKIIRQGTQEVVRPHPKNPRRTTTHRVKFVEEYCPIVWDPSLQEIRSARRDYQRWWAALDHLRFILAKRGGLSKIEISKRLPPRRPWATCEALRF